MADAIAAAGGTRVVIGTPGGRVMLRDVRWTSHLFHLSFIALVGAALFLASCSQREVVQEEPNFSPTPGKSYVAPKVERIESIELSSAYFEYDKWDLKPGAKAVLRRHAEWLRKNPDADIQIEGHCDERGSYEYNLVLGEKRANAAKRYLIQQGIAESRLQAVSRGKVFGLQPSKMAKNRKAVFIVFYRE